MLGSAAALTLEVPVAVALAEASLCYVLTLSGYVHMMCVQAFQRKLLQMHEQFVVDTSPHRSTTVADCSACLHLSEVVRASICPQVKFEAGAPLFAVHTELVTADGNTCRVSVGNIFKAENLKASTGAAAAVQCCFSSRSSQTMVKHMVQQQCQDQQQHEVCTQPASSSNSCRGSSWWEGMHVEQWMQTKWLQQQCWYFTQKAQQLVASVPSHAVRRNGEGLC